MSGLNLNRERIALLRAFASGDVFRTAGGILMRRFPPSLNKARLAEGKFIELRDAGLVDDELRVTEAGEAAIQAAGPAPAPVPRGTSSDFTRGPKVGNAVAAAEATVTSVLRWEDPPDSPRAGRWRPVIDWYRVTAQLRDRPHCWALILAGGHNSNIAAHVRSGYASVALRPAGSFDAKSVRVDGEYRLYARYIGETPPP